MIQYILNFFKRQSNEHLLLINVVIFSVAIIGLFVFGIQHPETLSLTRYTMGHIYAYFAVIMGTIFLHLSSILLLDKPKYYYPLSIFGFGIILSALLYYLAPEIFDALIGNFFSFFGELPTTLTIQEARPWSFIAAWETFHFGLILMIGGFGVLLYKLVKEDHPHNLFVIIWSAIILFSTMRHIRYEYYLALNIALLAGVFVGTIFLYGWKDLVSLYKKDVKEEPQKIVEQKSKKRKKGGEKKAKEAKNKPDYVKIGNFSLVLIFTLLFVYLSLSTNIAMATSVGRSGMNGDWRSSLEWLQDNTPDTGLDYYTIYEKETFSYPPESYGVMSWWDYGHWITFVAHRIPNANPFQAGVAGPNGSAAFFIQQSEADSSKILDNLGTRYVITDIEMDTGKFWAMATWYNGTLGVAPYQMQVLNQQGQPITVYKDAYFQTMISRLHNFDGSHTEPDPQFVFDFQGTRVSPLFIKPVEVVPALYHYRLVHESPTNVFNSPEIDLKYVKIFEFVPGARIKGQGVISVPVETDTGRTFVYRQESINGEFIVPYSTSGNPYDVRTTGKYTIEGTDLVFDVPEEAVIGGLSIN
jgi:oligosaccharyl transferase (archaeosortase A-associated)